MVHASQEHTPWPTCCGRDAERSLLLIVEDDKPFLQRLARAMEGRGFTVRMAESVADGLAAGGDSLAGFRGCRHAARRRQRAGRHLGAQAAPPDARAIVLTGYGNIATAVNAVKLGAVDYLSKPADADDWSRRCSRSTAARPSRRRTRCRRIACAGSTSSASTSCATATSRRPRAASTCTGARCSASSPSARRK